MTIAAEKPTTSAIETNLSYTALCTRLDLQSPIDLEHLVTQAIYNDLISAALNPAAQTVVITSVAPLRDLAPGSVADMVAELSAWSGRCDDVLKELEAEIAKVKADAKKRAAREARTEKQVKGVMDAGEKGASGPLGETRSGRTTRGNGKKDDDAYEDLDAMDVDGGQGTTGGLGGPGSKRTGSGGDRGGGGGGFAGLGKMLGRSNTGGGR